MGDKTSMRATSHSVSFPNLYLVPRSSLPETLTGGGKISFVKEKDRAGKNEFERALLVQNLLLDNEFPYAGLVWTFEQCSLLNSMPSAG